MADAAMLAWAVWRCLRHRYRTAQGITNQVVEPVDVLANWHLCRPDDQLLLARFREHVETALPKGQPGDPQGLNIDVRTNRGAVELWVGWDEDCPFDARPADAKDETIVALLRHLMDADDPPSAPSRDAAPAAACPVCRGKGSIGPVHLNRGRQPHQWVTVPCSCVAGAGAAADPADRMVQQAAAEFAADRETTRAPAPPPPAPPPPTPAAKPAPAPKPAPATNQMDLF